MTIGIFDSGLGGLTVLREVERVFPAADFIYFGDTAHLPYGTKSQDAVRQYLLEHARWIAERERLDAFVIACATASSVYLSAESDFREELKQAAGSPVIDVLTPSFSWLREHVPPQSAIGFLGTPATVASNVAQQALARYALSVKACPLLVPLIEEGWLEHRVLQEVLEEYLGPLREQGITHLILGCTHYPIIADKIRAILGEQVGLINLGAILAEKLREASAELPQDAPSQEGEGFTPSAVEGSVRFFVTDKPYRFSEISSMILKRRVEAELVRIS